MVKGRGSRAAKPPGCLRYGYRSSGGLESVRTELLVEPAALGGSSAERIKLKNSCLGGTDAAVKYLYLINLVRWIYRDYLAICIKADNAG